MRDDFNATHGAHIPADLCLCIENPPTVWTVAPSLGDALETLPDIDSDLLAQVRKETLTASDALTGCQAREKLSAVSPGCESI